MLLIKNTHMTDPASGTDAYKDILIQDEKIIKKQTLSRKQRLLFFPGKRRTCFRS